MRSRSKRPSRPPAVLDVVGDDLHRGSLTAGACSVRVMAVAVGLQGPGCIPTPRAPRVTARVTTDLIVTWYHPGGVAGLRPGRLKQEVASEDGQPGARRLEANHGVTPSGAGARGKRLELSAELLSILLVGVALAALILTGIGGIREDMREIREDMRERFSAMESRMSSMESRLAVVEREQGEIRGPARRNARCQRGPGNVGRADHPSGSNGRTASVNPSSSFDRTTSNRTRIDAGAFETTHARSAHSSMSRSL